MNKVFGKKSDFSLIRRNETSRIAVCYDLEQANDQGDYTWNEVYFFKKEVSNPNIDQVKKLIWDDINEQIDNKILSGFVWNDTSIWLSTENQFNYKAAFDLAMMTSGANLPITFKFGSDNDPVYHEFKEIAELQDFYTKAVSYINTCLSEGWIRKDSFNWEEYEEALKPKTEEKGEAEEEK